VNRVVVASRQREMIARYLAVLCAFRLSILLMLECDSDLSVENWKAVVLAQLGAAFVCDSDLSVENWKAVVLAQLGAAFVLGMTLNAHMPSAFIDHY
jgi:hypothetical protein